MAQDSSAILLVEDDPGQARLAQRVLRRAGYSCDWVASAAACFDRVLAEEPLMVLLDRELPDGDGMDVLARLRAALPELCVIMLTGADDVNLAVRAMRTGAWDYVLKRADVSHLEDLPLVIERNRERISLRRERERLDAAVRLSEERYRELFNNASDLIVVCDEAGVIQQTNCAFEEFTGVSPEAAVGRRLALFVAPESLVSADELRRRAMDEGLSAATSEVHLLGRAARPFIIEFRTRPFFVKNRPTGFQAIGRDVTEKRRMEEMKADFLAMVTHDMKNPVSIIAGYTEILLSDSGPTSEWREMLVSIDSSARGLLHLVLNFLDLSRIEAGALRPTHLPADVNGILAQVIDHQAPLARLKDLHLEPTYGSLPLISADQLQLQRVFANLVGNAVKFTPAGGLISISTSPEGERVLVRIADTGPGVPADEIPQLFAKYKRLAQAAQIAGTGLGLFIAKSMVEAHGGSVWVERAPSGGAAFVVSLPVAAAPSRDAEDRDGQPCGRVADQSARAA